MVTIQKISNNCTRFELNTAVTIRFQISNIRTALAVTHKLWHTTQQINVPCRIP